MPLFVRITAIVAVGIVALVVIGFVLKIVLLAALIGALIVGGITVARFFQRRRNGAITVSSRRF